MGSKFVSFPKPRSCETLKTPLDALANEKEISNEINDIEDPCTDLWRRMFVWWDGKVNPCDYDYKSTLSVWNAQNMSIKDIWTSEAYQEIRNKHLKKNRKKNRTVR